MMVLAASEGIENTKRPTVMDFAIDDGTFVTGYTAQECRMIRGYSFAAEEVCKRIRNEIMAEGMS